MVDYLSDDPTAAEDDASFIVMMCTEYFNFFKINFL